MPTHNLVGVNIISRIKTRTHSKFHLVYHSGQIFVHFLVHLSGFSESRLDLLLQKIVYGQYVFFFHARQYMGVPVEGDADRRMVRGLRNNFLWVFLQR